MKKARAFVPLLIKAIWLDTMAIKELKVESKIHEHKPEVTQDNKEGDPVSAFIASINKFEAEEKLRTEIEQRIDELEVRDLFCELSAFYLTMFDRLAFLHNLGEQRMNLSNKLLVLDKKLSF